MIYKTYLRTRDKAEKKNDPRTILLTTHSPNIVGVTPLNDIVVLRKSGDSTQGFSLANLKFDDEEIAVMKKKSRNDRKKIKISNEIFLTQNITLFHGMNLCDPLRR
jgi:putative ATP-dependent endonuclease of OLD family